MQAKKDVQFTKEIDERVKKQIKATQKQISYQHRMSNKDVYQGKENINLQQYNNNPLERKLPVIGQEGLKVNQLMKISNENPIGKLNERIRNIQFQIANKINESNNNINKQKKQQKMIGRTQTAIKDKLNELKPQMIKLWAKLDTLQDRILFNQRKIDQKNRLINQLVLAQKQNNWTRMEEKVKMLQMEIYASLKEIKIKIDTKVNTSDYQNYLTLMEGKIKQINEMIALKSDKLEVKKALIFLQSKIKEIILVISQDEQNQKDALLTRKQLKCISCDKEVDKLSGVISGIKGNWDCMPIKDHAPEILGRFGMTSFGSLSKKLKKLENKDLPLLNKKNCNINNNNNSNINNNNNSNINNNSNNSP